MVVLMLLFYSTDYRLDTASLEFRRISAPLTCPQRPHLSGDFNDDSGGRSIQIFSPEMLHYNSNPAFKIILE